MVSIGVSGKSDDGSVSLSGVDYLCDLNVVVLIRQLLWIAAETVQSCHVAIRSLRNAAQAADLAFSPDFRLLDVLRTVVHGCSRSTETCFARASSGMSGLVNR